MQRRTFGRRADPQQAPQPPRKAVTPVKRPEDVPLPDLEDELRDWKQARRKNFRIPWRPLSLMAGLCFGIASFVLPDSVNDGMQWLLYALMAASFYAGLRKRKAARARD